MRRVVLLLAVVVGACSSGGRSVPVEVPKTRTTVVRPPAEDLVPGASVEPVATERTDERQLVGVRSARQAGFDRVVFEFADAVAGFKADYVADVVQDGSGEVVDVEGPAKLVLRMSASEPLNTPTPRRIRSDTVVVTEVVRVSQFEGDLVWAIGVRQKTPFHITALDGPPRLVVDFPTTATATATSTG